MASGSFLEGVEGTGRTVENQGSNKKLEENSEGLGASKADQDRFMKILLAQLKNQNPMDPMKNKDFVSQMAQLTSLQQMNKMTGAFQSFNKAAESRQFLTLMGKQVSIKKQSGNSVSGTVTSVKFTENSAQVVMQNGKTVGTDQIAEIGIAGQLAGSGGNESSSGDNTSGTNSSESGTSQSLQNLLGGGTSGSGSTSSGSQQALQNLLGGGSQ